MLVTQQYFACPWKELSNCQIYLFFLATKVNRLGVDKRLWRNTANPKWLRIYSTPFDMVLTSKIWQKEEKGTTFRAMASILPSNSCMCLGPAFQGMAGYLANDGKLWINFSFCFGCTSCIYFSYLSVILLVLQIFHLCPVFLSIF